MHVKFILILAGIIIGVNVVHALVAVWAFRNRRDRPAGGLRLSLEEIKERRKLLNSFIILSICSVLPYKLREFFILVLHFVMSSAKTKLLWVLNIAATIVAKIAGLFVYFVGMPLTMVFERLVSKETIFVEDVPEDSNIEKRY